MKSRRWCATQQHIAVVQPGSNNAARNCLGVVSVEVTGLCNVSRVTVKLQVGIDGHAKRLELRCNWQSASGNVDGDDVGS